MKPMQIFANYDSVDVKCPCGASISGEGTSISVFIDAHKPHTNGKCVNTCTDDGARAYDKKPKPYTRSL